MRGEGQVVKDDKQRGLHFTIHDIRISNSIFNILT